MWAAHVCIRLRIQLQQKINLQKDDCIRKTNRRKDIRTHEHVHTGKSSAIFQNCKTKKHARAKNKNFITLARNYPHWRRRKICETMFIRDKNPTLKKQGDKHRQAYKLHLFAWNDVRYLTSDTTLEDYINGFFVRNFISSMTFIRWWRLAVC